MKRRTYALSALLSIFAMIFMSGCSEDHDATVNFNIELSDKVAMVADLYVAYSVEDGSVEFIQSTQTVSKTITGSMDKNSTGTFLVVSAWLILKDNYREVINSMSQEELNTFYNGCYFSSNLNVEIKDEPALNTSISNTCNAMPQDGILTASRVIQTLEKHSTQSGSSGVSLCAINVKKDKAKWTQIGLWDVWCEGTVIPAN